MQEDGSKTRDKGVEESKGSDPSDLHSREGPKKDLRDVMELAIANLSQTQSEAG